MTKLYQNVDGRLVETPFDSDAPDYVEKDIYAAEERIVGSWDGKPLYRLAVRNLVFPTLNTSGVSVYDLGLNDITVTRLRCLCKLTDGRTFSLPYKGPTARCFLGLRGGILYAYAQSTVFNKSTNQIVLEYTKTTD